MKQSPDTDRHNAVAYALNETEMVREEGVTVGDRSDELTYYRWQLPGSAVASEFLFHLQQQGYAVVKRSTDESVLS